MPYIENLNDCRTPTRNRLGNWVVGLNEGQKVKKSVTFQRESLPHPDIIAAKRPDIRSILITDGITWIRRKNDLRKLIKFQNEGKIMRIHTTKMAGQFETDRRQPKAEYWV